jgi:hypothetical protein
LQGCRGSKHGSKHDHHTQRSCCCHAVRAITGTSRSLISGHLTSTMVAVGYLLVVYSWQCQAYAPEACTLG